MKNESWVVREKGGTWFGFFGSREEAEEARERLVKRGDSLGVKPRRENLTVERGE